MLIGQFRYFKIQLKTIDITTKLRGINPTDSIVYSPEPLAEVYLHDNVITDMAVTASKALRQSLRKVSARFVPAWVNVGLVQVSACSAISLNSPSISGCNMG